ncbi:hypothetical protein MCEMSE6_01710 [Oxalobacteraceae bacterium]|jgi:hypothetical protein
MWLKTDLLTKTHALIERANSRKLTMIIMKKVSLCLLLLVSVINYATAQNLPPSLQGNWSGVWYVGMSSGKVNLRLDANGDGRISFTNFEEFSDTDIPISKLSLEGDTVKFSVPSNGNAEFAINLKFKQETKSLDGGGKFDGAGAKIVFNKAD